MSTRRDVTIHIGGVLATREPTVIRTLVGSCIAACVIDRSAHVSGMNHFMLPGQGNGHEDPLDRARFGLHAMDLLIGAMQKAGAERRRLVAKVFGGAHVLQLPESVASIPQQNIRFIEEFMATEDIPIVGWDVGGYLPRRVHLHTDTGAVYVKRLGARTLHLARVEEREHLRVMRRTTAPVGDVTMFETEREHAR